MKEEQCARDGLLRNSFEKLFFRDGKKEKGKEKEVVSFLKPNKKRVL